MSKLPDWARRGQAQWTNTGVVRPHFAVDPGPGQESVWDYPRPPVLVPDDREVRVSAGDELLCTTRAALRVLETASPPTFYLPPADITAGALVPCAGSSACEWKGQARYWSLCGSDEPVAWTYPEPFDAFEALRGYVAFYPGRVECYVADKRVQPQAGGFYGGWVTDEIVGPWKGEAGSGGW